VNFSTGRTIPEIWRAFCEAALIQHNGILEEPPPLQKGLSASDLRVEEDTGPSGAPRVFADHVGPSDELSERKLAELYEQLDQPNPLSLTRQ
jgi:hypothetical protein